MSSNTYKTKAIVLSKTKLSDKDLIVRMLDESGALLQGVAKGARKPGGSLAARLELFTTVDLMMARGRSLDVVCEARLVGTAGDMPSSLEQTTCASPIAELLGLVAQPGLEQPRLFDMARVAFGSLASCDDAYKTLAISTAALWKVMGQVGLRPSLDLCALCASPVSLEQSAELVPFSAIEGGLTCSSCPQPADAVILDSNTIRWLDALIMSRFDDIIAFGLDTETSFQLLSLAQSWARVHLSRSLKSLDFLFTAGLFG